MSKKEIELEYSWKYNADEYWPYNGIVNDLYRGIQAYENYLVVLGLVVYSEYIGREVLGTINEKDDGTVPFEKFTKEYIGYSFNDWKKVFDDIRNGLAYRYFMKEYGGVINDDGNSSCGIKYLGNGNLEVYINSYFQHFVKGLEKYLDEKSKPVERKALTTG